MKRKQYKDIRPNLQTGDLIAFGGQTFISATIKKITSSNVSHVGMVLIVKTIDFGMPIVMIVESTSIGDGFAGVRISQLSTRIKAYSGDIWILPVDGARNTAGIESYLTSILGTSYDYTQAIGSAIDFTYHPDQQKDLDKLFCSELCNEAYLQNLLNNASVIPQNSSEQTPIDVCNLPIYKEVFQVAGSLKGLS